MPHEMPMSNEPHILLNSKTETRFLFPLLTNETKKYKIIELSIT